MSVKSDQQASFMCRMIAQQRSSGLRKAAFCQQEGISLATFYYWQRKLSAQSMSNPHLDSGFVQLEPHPSYCVSIRVKNGNWVSLQSETASSIAAIIKELSAPDA